MHPGRNLVPVSQKYCSWKSKLGWAENLLILVKVEVSPVCICSGVNYQDWIEHGGSGSRLLKEDLVNLVTTISSFTSNKQNTQRNL